MTCITNAGDSVLETVAEIFVVLGEQRVDHRKTHAVDGTPSPSIGSKRRHGPDSDPTLVACAGEQLAIGQFQHD